MSLERQEFSENLRRLRKSRDMTQEELSVQSGYDRTYIGKIERGSKDPSFSAIVRIAETLGVSVPELFKSPVVTGTGGSVPSKPAEESDALETAEPEFYRRLFRSSDHMMVVTDPRAVILDINPATLSFCGHRAEEVLGLSLLNVRIWHSDAQQMSRFRQALLEARTGSSYRETIQAGGNGTRKTVSLSVKPLMVTEDGAVQFILVEGFLAKKPDDGST